MSEIIKIIIIKKKRIIITKIKNLFTIKIYYLEIINWIALLSQIIK